MAQSEDAEKIGKRSGAVQHEIYMKDEFQRLLQGLVERLNETITGFKYDKRNLSQLLAGLQQFLEDAYGVNALVKATPKLPAKLFDNFSPEGPLATIATLCADLMKTKGQKRIDWSNPALRKDNTDLVLRIRQELLRSGHIRNPRVFIQPACPNESLIRAKILRLGGEVVQKETAAGVTHIICPYGTSGDPDDGREYLRTMKIRGDMAKVHWWYLPDSYNEWIPTGSAPVEVESDLRPPGGRPWRVYYRWVIDSEKYNEWMNETDYETAESTIENKRARDAGEGNAEATREKKKSKREGKTAAGMELVPGIDKVIGPGAVMRHVLVPNKKVLEGAGGTIDISHGQRQEWAGIPIASDARARKISDRAPNAAAVHIVPAAAGWFKLNSVGDIERLEFPEFFDNRMGRSEALYLTYRNHMVSCFRENPSRHISFLEAMRGLDGDANDLLKIFQFLVRWGVINFTLSDRSGAHLDGDGNVSGHPVGAAAIVQLHRRPTPKHAAEAASQGGSTRVAVRNGTFRRAAPQAPAIATGTKYFCNAYPHIDCTALRYHCTKIPDVDICPLAYAEGRFPPGCSAKDFVKVTATDPVRDDSGWSDQETLLLLEGVDMFGEDWAQISQHVRGKSQLECVQRILTLPIEEVVLPDAGSAGLNVTTLHEAGVGSGVMDGQGIRLDAAAAVPFAESGNPVMAQIAFLMTTIGPKVAASAAQAALECLSEDNVVWGASGAQEDTVREAAVAGLAAAAVKARRLADSEEREMQRMVLAACETQLRRIEAKLKHLDEIDEAVKNEIANKKNSTAQYMSHYESMMAEKERKGGGEGGHNGTKEEEKASI